MTWGSRRSLLKARDVVVLGFGFAAVTGAVAQAATADWEASGAGAARASFALSRTPASGGTGPRTISDLVVQAPIHCADSPVSEAPVDVEVIPGSLIVTASGAFTSGRIHGGSGTTVAGRLVGSRLTLSYRHVAVTANAFDGGAETCDTRTIALHGRPGKRLALADARWLGQTQTSEPVALNIVAGGRALQEPRYVPANGGIQASIAFGAFTQNCFTAGCSPSSTDICAFQTPATVFVGADGSFGNTAVVSGDQAVFAGRFTSARAVTGTFANGGEGCGQTTWVAGPTPRAG